MNLERQSKDLNEDEAMTPKYSCLWNIVLSRSWLGFWLEKKIDCDRSFKRGSRATIDYPLSLYIWVIARKMYRIIRRLLNWGISAVSVISAFRRSVPASMPHGTQGFKSVPIPSIPITIRSEGSPRYFLDRSICTSPRSRIIDDRVIGWPKSVYIIGRRRG